MTMAWIARELNAGVPQTLWRAFWAKRGKAIIRGTSLKKRCQEGILLVAFDEIDARYQWVSLGVWEVHFQA
jgi:hypothetical protein